MSHANQIEYLEIYPDPIWYDPIGIINILSMKILKIHVLITFGKGECFVLERLVETRAILSRQSGDYKTLTLHYP